MKTHTYTIFFKLCLAIGITGFFNHALAFEWSEKTVTQLIDKIEKKLGSAGDFALKGMRSTLESAYMWAKKHNHHDLAAFIDNKLVTIDTMLHGAVYAEAQSLKRKGKGTAKGIWTSIKRVSN